MIKNENNKFNVCFYIDEDTEIEQEINRIPNVGETILLNIEDECIGFEVLKIVNYIRKEEDRFIIDNHILIVLKEIDIEVTNLNNGNK